MFKKNTYLLRYGSLLFAVVYLVSIVFLNEVPADDGDGLQHYYISKHAFSDPSYFLNHWGKPLFILFSSAFAQFGFIPYLLFNVLVFVATILFAFSIFKQHNISKYAYFFVPLLFLYVSDYLHGIVSGMTEIFFGFLLVILLWCSQKDRWQLFAIIASFTPYARSEGMFVVIGSVLLLLLLKKWKAIPLLFVGTLVYMLIGKLLLNQIFWFFENDPYPAISPYGSGPWYEYIASYKHHLSVFGLLLIPFLLRKLFLLFRDKKSQQLLIYLFFICIYLGIIAVHSYLWSNGLKGALGLSRLATLGLVPFFVLLFLSFYDFMQGKKHYLGIAIGFIFLVFMGIKLFKYDYPIKKNKFQALIKASVDYTNKHAKKNVYYLHPLIPFFNDASIFETKNGFYQTFSILTKENVLRLKPGDLIIRDSKLGPVEQGMSFDELKKYTFIIPVKHFYENTSDQERNGEKPSVIIYQILDSLVQRKKKFQLEKNIIYSRKVKKSIKKSMNTFNYQN